MTGDSPRMAELTEESARAAAVAAVRSCGLDPGEASLVRMGSRAVFRLVDQRVLARVTRRLDEDDAVYELHMARWLGAAGVPVDEPWPGSEAYEDAGLTVTLWKAHDGTWASTGELASALRMLHGVPDGSGPLLRPWGPFAEMRSRVARSTALTDAELSELTARIDECESRMNGVRFLLEQGVIHGDASVGNILRADTGELVLFDLGGVCFGPREWDLVSTAVYWELGWHSEEEYRDFARVYGFDVRSWDGYSVLAEVQKLRMICWLAGRAATAQDDSDDELHRRIESLAEGGKTYEWRPL